MNGNRIQSIKWGQHWKAHLFQQDTFMGTWTPLNEPHLVNLLWDPREEHQVSFPHTWVAHPLVTAAGAFLKTLVVEPPIKPGTPDPYEPPEPGEFRPESHLQLGPIIQYVTSLAQSHDQLPDPHVGIEHQSG
jgi:arylsulfatase